MMKAAQESKIEVFVDELENVAAVLQFAHEVKHRRGEFTSAQEFKDSEEFASGAKTALAILEHKLRPGGDIATTIAEAVDYVKNAEHTNAHDKGVAACIKRAAERTDEYTGGNFFEDAPALIPLTELTKPELRAVFYANPELDARMMEKTEAAVEHIAEKIFAPVRDILAGCEIGSAGLHPYIRIDNDAPAQRIAEALEHLRKAQMEYSFVTPYELGHSYIDYAEAAVAELIRLEGAEDIDHRVLREARHTTLSAFDDLAELLEEAVAALYSGEMLTQAERCEEFVRSILDPSKESAVLGFVIAGTNKVTRGWGR